ncbi:lipase-like, partial [Camellia sinensis]|uniref:lipase-like n=1 Tax=Camellia sinensis TaxID=4442 RepID=UPI001035E594
YNPILFIYFADYEEQISTQAMMFNDTTSNPDLIMVAFRGTEPFDADKWRTDVDFSWFDLHDVGKIHGGFMKALGLQKKTGWPKEIDMGPGQPSFAYYTIRQKLKDILMDKKYEKTKFIVTGHSLGGALAILFVAVLVLHEEAWLLERLDGVYTFGQPRVGDEQFGEFMKEKLRVYDVKYLRYVYCNDMVPRLPYDNNIFLYKHFGPCLYFTSCYKGKVNLKMPYTQLEFPQLFDNLNNIKKYNWVEAIKDTLMNSMTNANNNPRHVTVCVITGTVSTVNSSNHPTKKASQGYVQAQTPTKVDDKDKLISAMRAQMQNMEQKFMAELRKKEDQLKEMSTK